MPDSLTTETESDFVCDCDEWMRSVCQGEPFYREHEGKRYCVLHYPAKEKSADFRPAFQRKLESKDFNFRGVWFPDPLSFVSFDFDRNADFMRATFSAAVNFSNATFRAEANFNNATFTAGAYFLVATFTAEADFSAAAFRAEANFNKATFRAEAYFLDTTFTAWADFSAAAFNMKAYFIRTKFSARADFSEATFSAAAVFSGATFSAAVGFIEATFSAVADFIRATFSAESDFSDATFSAAAYFNRATFAGYVRFSGSAMFNDASSLDLQFARIERPDRVSFHTLRLRPHWFINVDARKFDLTNVDWYRRGLAAEILSLRNKSISSPHRHLAIACRHLAVNAEDSQRYGEASRFRYMAMDAKRQTQARGLAFWKLSWWYWVASGYGERATQAFLVLLAILVLSALLYTQVGFVRWEPRLASESDAAVAVRDGIGKPLSLPRALAYSGAVMTLQKPVPRPATIAAQTVVLLETILGPVQAALLALAIRRKFMR